MKKILGKIKKIFIMIEAFFISMSAKVLATDVVSDIQAMYGIPKEETKLSSIFIKIVNIIDFVIIPIAFIIGTIIYFKKSSKSVSKKILMIVLAFILVVVGIILIKLLELGIAISAVK